MLENPGKETIVQEEPDESGFSTAELLANVGIAVVVLFFIWNTLIGGNNGLAADIIQFIRDTLGIA